MKNLGTCIKHRKYRQKMKLRTHLELQNCDVFDLVNVLKFKMWKGDGGYPLFVLGGFRSQKCSKKTMFLEKSLRRNAVNSSVFAFCGLLPWKM